jgi:hypothetical protein
VLARGYDPRAYSECLIDMARSVTQSGVRLNIAGLAMPGSTLPRRIRRILEGGSVPQVSRTRMALVCVACAISCTAIASGTLDHAQPNSSAERGMSPRGTASEEHPATKFVLSDLKIEGDIHDRDGVRDRILKALKSQEYDDGKALADDAAAGIRADFQERGYFQVVVLTLRRSLFDLLMEGRASSSPLPLPRAISSDSGASLSKAPNLIAR